MSFIANVARFADNRLLGPAARRMLAKSFKSGPAERYAVLYEPNRISFSQVYPFVLYADEFERRYGIQLRFFSVDTLAELDFSAADQLLVQLWFTHDPAVFEQVFEKAAHGGAEITAFLDSFAHNDLRLASLLNKRIRYYLKKSLFRDRTQYSQSTIGHTNLTDYYSRAYGLQDEAFHWPIPDGFVDKLRLSPNFFTAPRLYKLFLDQDIDTVLARPRETDVHSRLGTRGTPWYSAMRAHAIAAVSDLADVRVISEGKVTLRQFNAELLNSKACFSPFGFGELCWRDIEAMAFGSVLLKPSMDHLETLPDLYESHVTYIPLAWDFSDLAEKVDWVRSNPDSATTIARTAFMRVRNYLRTGRFVDDMKFLFKQ